MKIKLIFLWIFCLWMSTNLWAQESSKLSYETELRERGEVYFSFSLPSETNSIGLMNEVGRFISIDNKKGNQVFAYANRTGFEQFLTYHLPYQVHTSPSLLLSKKLLQHRNQKSSLQWDYYPTYEEYITLMKDFVVNHPKLCEMVSIGKSVQGRDLLFIHFKHMDDSLNKRPQFMYTATMHGDETTPYVLMLHLIDYLLKNYGTLPRITHLVDSLDIWINPLANPDGTYAGGNSSVYGATRLNANHIDLNRNYPDPRAGDHPDGKVWQVETQHFMDFASAHHFVLSCNMHTGSEVANYPWDTWQRRHADDTWWQQVCRQYADTVHKYAPYGYLTDLNNGITDGYDWYSITGGRQDYMNYFQHDREFTLEMSTVKMPDPVQLPGYWEDNYRSLIDYMEQAFYGIRGTVYDSITGKTLEAKIFITDHDTDHSEVYSTLPLGYFCRPIAAGNYQLQISDEGYVTKTIKSLDVIQNQSIFVSVALKPKPSGLETQNKIKFSLYPNPAKDFIRLRLSNPIDNWSVFDMMGHLMKRGLRVPAKIDVSNWLSGTYFIRITDKNITSGQAFQVRH